jgi:hypothetical protein
MEQTFDDRQKSYYTTEINRAFPANSQPDTNAIQLALGLVDAEMPSATRTVSDAVSFASDFGRSSSVIQRDIQCARLPFPSAGMRDPSARTGCGWWFVPSPSQSSTGALGTRRGPMNPQLDQRFGSGQWIWDPAQAQRLESEKQAAKIQSCPDLALRQNPNIGWCTTTNRAIVTDGRGNAAHPQDAGQDCDSGSIVMTPDGCPAPPSSGAGAAAAPSVPPGITGLCQPGAGGALSTACLAAVSALNCPQGELTSLYKAGSYPAQSQDFVLKNSILNSSGFQFPAGMTDNGQTTLLNALNATWALRSFAQEGQGRGNLAAANLCLGSPFDPCSFAPSDQGPFDAACITQAALAQGYSAKGGIMPANIGINWWNQNARTWQDVLNILARWKNMAVNPQPTQPQLQLSAITNVFGATAKFPKQSCNNNGILCYRYFFPTWDQSLFSPSGPQTHFLGRHIFKSGFPQQGSTYQDQTPGGLVLTEGQRMITVFTPTESGTYQFLLGHDDGVRLMINDQVFQDWAPCCGNTTTPTMEMLAGQQYTLTIDFWNGGGPWTFLFQMSINGGAWQPIPVANLTMTQDRRLPMIELAFQNMTPQTVGMQSISIQDTNKVFQNLFLYNTQIGPYNGRQAMIVKGSVSGVFNYMNLVQGIRINAMKTMTMMVWVDTVSYPQGITPSLVAFFNLPESVIQGYPRKGWNPNFIQDYHNRTNDFILTTNGNTLYPWGRGPLADGTPASSLVGGAATPFPLKQWVHIAWVWNDAFDGYVLYINGKEATSVRVSGYSPQQIMEQIRIGGNHAANGESWTGAISWFRAFDYRLSPDLIQRDMTDDWANLV